MLFIMAFAAQVATQSADPWWWGIARKHDSDHLYFTAKCEAGTSEGARRAALESGMAQFAGYVSSGVGGNVADVVGEVREAEAFHTDEVFADGRYRVWMLVRVPRGEYDRHVGRLERAARLESGWKSAQSLANRGLFKEAGAELEGVLKMYDGTLGLAFAEDEVKLKLAEVFKGQARNSRARKWAGDVVAGTTDAGLRRKAEEFVKGLPQATLRDALNPDGKACAVYALKRGGAGWVHWAALSDAAKARRASEKILCEIAGEGRVWTGSEEGGEEGGEEGIFKMIAVESDRRGLPVALVLGLVAPKNKKSGEGGGLEELGDIFWWVIRSSDGEVVSSGGTKVIPDNPAMMVRNVFGLDNLLRGDVGKIVGALEGE